MRPILCFLLALPFWASGQGEANALLWRIGPSGDNAASYLLGTVHSRDARAYTMIDLAKRAINATGSVYGELDMRAAKDANSSMASLMIMSGGMALKDLYSPVKYKRVEKALRAKAGPMYLMMTHMKPLVLSAMLTEESMGKDSAQVLDDYLQTHALALGKRTGGIETMAEQLAAMDAIPLKEQADMLYEAVRSQGSEKDMDLLLDAYARQDLHAIGKLMKDGGMSDAFSRALLSERNQVMAHRIDSLMHEGTALFAVGAAHLPGEGGVLALLRAKGMNVEPALADQLPEFGPDAPPPPMSPEEERRGGIPAVGDGTESPPIDRAVAQVRPSTR